MGYSTVFTLSCSDDETLQSEVDCVEFDGLLSREDDETLQGEGKWYDHETDMRKVSARNPGVLFTLHGEGEENGDIWNKYFLNGKMQEERARIVIDDFDSAKLT